MPTLVPKIRVHPEMLHVFQYPFIDMVHIQLPEQQGPKLLIVCLP